MIDVAPRRGALCLALLTIAIATPARAVDANCMTAILHDVPALEAPEQVKSKRSGTFGPITHIKVSKKTGRMFYCSSNSYCYDSNSFRITSACRFKLDKGAGTDEFFQYSAR